MERSIEVQTIENTFYDYYSSMGYEILPEQPAYPSSDNSVLFIGAQISTWKPRLLESLEYVESITNPQTCVRTQNLKHYLNPETSINFCTVFRTHGVLTNRDFQTTIDESYEYITEKLNVSTDRVMIKASESLAKKFSSPCDVQIDKMPDSYYRWEYGDPRLAGSGITYAIKTPEETFLDIGNVIEIYKDGTLSAIEWGFGEEILAQSISGGEHPLVHSRFLPDSVRHGIDNPLSIRLADSALAIVHLANIGVSPSHKDVGNILLKYMQSFGYLAATSSFSSSEDLIKEIAEHNVTSNALVKEIVSKTCRIIGSFVYKMETLETNQDVSRSAVFSNSEIDRIVVQ